MAKFTIKGISGPYLDHYVIRGSFTPNREVIEARCFYNAIETALGPFSTSARFIDYHEQNSASSRVYTNNSYFFLVEKIEG